MLPWLFFIFFVEIIKENIVVWYKIGHAYSTIHQLALVSFSLVFKDFCNYKLFFSHTTVFMHPIFKLTRQIFSMHIFFAFEYSCNHWYPDTQEHLILQTHVFDIPNRSWKTFDGIRYCFEYKLIFLIWNVFNISSSLFSMR